MRILFLATAALIALSACEDNPPALSAVTSSGDTIDCGFAVLKVSPTDQKRLSNSWGSQNVSEDLCQSIHPLLLATTEMGVPTPDSISVDLADGQSVEVIVALKRRL